MNPTVGVLGPLVASDGERALGVGKGAQRIVLNVLAVSADGVHVDDLVEVLRDLSGEPRTTHNVHSAITRLRGLLPGCIESNDGRYRLQASVSVDADSFTARTSAAFTLRERGDERAVPELRAALGMWRGPALFDWRDHRLARSTVERLEELRLTAMHELAGALVDQHEDAAAIDALVDVIALDPLRERSWVLLLDVQSRLGRHDDVTKSLARAHHALAEVGLEPGAELREAAARHRGMHFAILGGGTHRADGIVGRDAELALLNETIASTLRGGPSALIAITGEPGVGKSRLAAELVRGWSHRGVEALLERATADGLDGIERRRPAPGVLVIDGVNDDALDRARLGGATDPHRWGPGVVVVLVAEGPAALGHVPDRVALGRLDREGTRALLAARSREEVDDRLADAAWRLTAGNPALCRAVSDDPSVLRFAGTTPAPTWGSSAIVAAVEAIVRSVPTAARAVLELAAVAAAGAGTYDPAVLRAVAVSTAATPFDGLDGLAAAHASGLVGDSDQPGLGAFTHDAVRLGLYAAMPSARRASAHLAAGQALERLGRHAGPVELALHFTRAWPAVAAREAATYCRRAAEWAMTEGALDVAEAQFTAGVELLAVDGDPTDTAELDTLREGARAARSAAHGPGQPGV